MKIKYILIALLLTIVTFLVTYFYYELHKQITYENFSDINTKIIVFYGQNLRGNLFTGFLALGGFIFSLKAFILVTMKQNVYDNDFYEKKWLDLNKGNECRKAYFLPLRQLNEALYLTVLLAIISSIINITIGLLPNIYVVYVCIFTSLWASIYLVQSLYLVKRNLDTWFEYLSLSEFKKHK
ncbi:hypothetical protein [Acinetobacter sp. YH12102]|uniref:hypothetical protein n=1 Tax=Acinetobacter sp. YH12102 TaxID=2601091 RepID=UPI0015D1A19B|nr:hypothetical protein [Acinetobacter sp. YH12102]